MIRIKYIFANCRPCSHYIPRGRKKKIKRMITNRSLIDIDDFGIWYLRGLSWRDLYIGEVITENTYLRICSALSKLLDYEMTGLSPEEVEELKEKAGVGNG